MYSNEGHALNLQLNHMAGYGYVWTAYYISSLLAHSGLLFRALHLISRARIIAEDTDMHSIIILII